MSLLSSRPESSAPRWRVPKLHQKAASKSKSKSNDVLTSSLSIVDDDDDDDVAVDDDKFRFEQFRTAQATTVPIPEALDTGALVQRDDDAI